MTTAPARSIKTYKLTKQVFKAIALAKLRKGVRVTLDFSDRTGC